jgi:formylglycine-generating enzyme required for sulfatase activity
LPPVFGALLFSGALLAQSASADQPASSCEDCPEMVTIPAGSYLMGKTIDYGYGDMDGPRHTVTIPQPFAMAVREVTLGEYRKFIRDSGYVPARKCNIYKEDAKWFIEPKRSWDAPGFKQGEDHPVVCVSWLDAQAYIKWLNARTGQNYRLPSEAEWEYVATLADLGDVRGGGEVTHEVANIGKVECCGGETGGRDVWMHTAPVGSFPKDRFGLHDIRGNVWEWQSDCFQQDYFDAPVDGSSRTTCPKMGYHVVRGASYGDGGEYLSERLRLQGTEDNGYFTVGFRLAQSLHPAPGSEPSTPASIAQPVTAMLAAIRQRDANALDGLLARTTDPEILYYWGETVSGRKPITEWHREWFLEQGWVLSPEKLLQVFVDGNLAQVNHSVEYIKSADRKFNIFFASTLIRESDGWKIARIQQTLLEGPK